MWYLWLMGEIESEFLVMEEKTSWIIFFMNMLFFVYFIILFGERMRSLICSVKDSQTNILGTPFNIIVYSILILSLLSIVVFLLLTNKNFFIGLFTRSLDVYKNIDYGKLCIAAGILLFSGMVHTNHTLTPVQFASYGALAVAIVLKNIDLCSINGSSAMSWISLVYLIVFSMAIPVVYFSQGKNAQVFHIIEIVTMIILVISFTFMMRQLFIGEGINLFYFLPIIIALIGNTLIVVIGFSENTNWFLLIFTVLSILMWILGKILSFYLK